VYTLAAKENNEQQQIKSLVYRLAIEEKIFDNKPNNSIAVLENEINQTKSKVLLSILHSLAAQQYHQYFSRNSWRFYNRSKTLNYKKEDIETWNADNFNEAINYHFTKSIEDAGLLQTIAIKDFSNIIIQGNTTNLRPTLFDVLAHEALNYFKSGIYYITKPAYAFTLQNINALLPAEAFIQQQFTHRDSSSHLLLALHLFQQLIALHITDSNKNAFIDVDLERLVWVNTNLINDKKAETYLHTLNNLIKQYSCDRVSQAYYLMASHYNDKGRLYQPFSDTINRYDLVKALSIIKEGLSKYRNSKDEGVSNLLHLQSQIEIKVSVSVQKKLMYPINLSGL